MDRKSNLPSQIGCLTRDIFSIVSSQSSILSSYTGAVPTTPGDVASPLGHSAPPGYYPKQRRWLFPFQRPFQISCVNPIQVSRRTAPTLVHCQYSGQVRLLLPHQANTRRFACLISGCRSFKIVFGLADPSTLLQSGIDILKSSDSTPLRVMLQSSLGKSW